MHRLHRLILAVLVCAASPVFGAANARRVVVVVWDAMRPDFVTEQNAPNLHRLAQQGVTFAHHHSVYPSSTEVNGTAISTGAYPAHDGILANHEYRPAIDPLKSIDTEAMVAVRKGDELAGGRYLPCRTIAETVRANGRKTVVAGAKPIALLADRAPRQSAADGINLFAGWTLPASLAQTLTQRYGPFPNEGALNPSRNDWTVGVLLGPLWGEGVPEFTFLWLSEPDITQHATGPGSKQSLAAIRNSDDNLGRVLKALEAKGLSSSTDVLVVSDHGCSTISAKADLVQDLNQSGIQAVREFKTAPARGEVLVVSNSGSTLVYVVGHEEKLIQQIVRFLQEWPFTGVIFTRQARPGTFSLKEIHLDSEDAADIVVALRWTAERNTNGAPGMMVTDRAGAAVGCGSHVSLSPFDMHNTLIAAGPDFRSGIISTLASGNVDLAPTVLWILGLKPAQPMDGRVLSEAFTIAGPAIKSSEPRHLEATQAGEKSVWHQYLNTTTVNGVTYYDEGNGHQLAK